MSPASDFQQPNLSRLVRWMEFEINWVAGGSITAAQRNDCANASSSLGGLADDAVADGLAAAFALSADAVGKLTDLVAKMKAVSDQIAHDQAMVATFLNVVKGLVGIFSAANSGASAAGAIVGEINSAASAAGT